MKQWEDFWSQTQVDIVLCSFSSLVCSIALMMLYGLVPSSRRTPGWYIIRGTACDIVVSLVTLWISYSTCSGTSKERFSFAGYYETSWIAVLMHTVAFFEMFANAWRLFIYVYTLIIYHNPFQPNGHRKVYPLFVTVWIVLSLSLTPILQGQLIPTGTTPAVAEGMKAGESSEELFRILGLGLFVMPCLTFIVVGGALHLTVRLLAYRVKISAQTNCGPQTSIPIFSRQRVVRHGCAYYCLFGSQLVAGTLAVVMLYTGHGAQFDCLWHLVAILAAGRPTISFIGWLAINEIPYYKCGMCSFRRHRHQSPDNDQIKLMQGIKEQGFKKELRFELLYDVARGIGELAQSELHMDLTAGRQHSRRCDIELVPQKRGKAQQSVSHSFDLGDLGLLRAEDRLEPGRFPSQWNSIKASSARHIRQQDFRWIRTACGISASTYARSFPNDLSAQNQDWQQKLKESVSEGASGCFFYRVWSNQSQGVPSRFIVKQITKKEMKTLESILPAYRDHIEFRKGKSLIHYYGCHSMRLGWTFSGEVYFVVMRNFLPVKCWLTFDLKGATANRRAVNAESLHRAGSGQRTYGTLRDWEWLDIAMEVEVSAADKEELAETIGQDSDFLSRQGLLDYSLLLGIHRLPPDLRPAEHEAALAELKEAGGYISLDRRKVYFFGIIDVLEKYTVVWRAQHWVLTASHYLACQVAHVDGISAMPPHEYADRFRTFVCREVLQCSGRNTSSFYSVLHNAGGSQDKYGGGAERWYPLWEHRRRGLVRDVIKAETAGHMERIEELTQQVSDHAGRVRELEQQLCQR